jgi:RNA polymerase sigma-70 factor (ECF subfamily)
MPGWCAHWPGATPSAELEQALQDLVQRADVWPGLPLDPAGLIGALAERLGTAHPEALAALEAADLHLACACAAGDPRALALFEEVLGAVRPAVAQLGASAPDVDEVLQRLRLQLLVGPPPGIAAYAGRGALRAWVRVVAVREAVRLLRDRGRARSLEDGPLLESLLPDAAPDAERELHGRQLRAAFREAFAQAIAGLPARDRLLLRQQVIDDLSIDEIGGLHRVNRATAARWLVKARQRLAADTRRALQARLGTSPAEVRRLLGLYLSRLDASVERLLVDDGRK